MLKLLGKQPVSNSEQCAVEYYYDCLFNKQYEYEKMSSAFYRMTSPHISITQQNLLLLLNTSEALEQQMTDVKSTIHLLYIALARYAVCAQMSRCILYYQHLINSLITIL